VHNVTVDEKEDSDGSSTKALGGSAAPLTSSAAGGWPLSHLRNKKQKRKDEALFASLLARARSRDSHELSGRIGAHQTKVGSSIRYPPTHPLGVVRAPEWLALEDSVAKVWGDICELELECEHDESGGKGAHMSLGTKTCHSINQSRGLLSFYQGIEDT
jgi:hypothetical protein